MLPLALAGSLLFASSACDDAAAACKVDTDCNPGQICSSKVCIYPNGSGPNGVGDADTTFEAAPICSNDGIPCTFATECCSGICQETKCGQNLTPTQTCKQQFESCLNDCCDGLTCSKGVCR